MKVFINKFNLTFNLLSSRPCYYRATQLSSLPLSYLPLCVLFGDTFQSVYCFTFLHYSPTHSRICLNCLTYCRSCTHATKISRAVGITVNGGGMGMGLLYEGGRGYRLGNGWGGGEVKWLEYGGVL